MTNKEWANVLDNIVDGFYLYVVKDDYKWTENDHKTWDEAKKLFIEYFEDFWD